MKRFFSRLFGLLVAFGLILSTGYGLVIVSQSQGEYQAFLPLIRKDEVHSISGQVLTPDGIPVPGVSILTADGYQATTDAEGNYTISSLLGTEYRVIPSKDGYGFSPSSVLVSVPPDVTQLNFTSSLLACTDIIVNGGFETNSGWELPVTEYTASYTSAEAHAGTRSLRTGIVYSPDNRYSYSSGRQIVTIPSSIASANLIFYIKPISTETTMNLPQAPTGEFVESTLAGDVQYVLVTDLYGNILYRPIWQKSNAGAWQGYSFDVTNLAGRTVYVHFGTYNDGYGGITSMYVDDVALQLCPSGTETPTPPPPSCGNLFLNDSFENSNGWEIPVTAYSAGYSTSRAHTGTRSMRTGITNSSINVYSYSDARQTVYVPTNTPVVKLGLWMYFTSSESVNKPMPAVPVGERFGESTLAGDVQYVLVLDQYQNIVEVLLWQRSNTQSWSFMEFDLHQYAGRVISIQFGTYNDGWGGITSMFVDDAAINTCTGTATATSSIPTATSTVTPTPSNTPPAPTCPDLIVNGGLETNSTWVIPLTVYPAAYSTDRFYAGLRSMRTGITNPFDNVYSYSDARQTVTIPVNATSATLSFYASTYSGESPMLALPQIPKSPTFGDAPLASDVQYLLVLDSNLNWIDTLVWQRNNNPSWIGYLIDIKRFAGRTISLQFGTYNDGFSGITYMYFDQVSLKVCTP